MMIAETWHGTPSACASGAQASAATGRHAIADPKPALQWVLHYVSALP